MKTPKILVIGLDGATWDLIEPWTKQGKLPTIQGLMKKGTYGNLMSTIPPVTAAAWVSLYTGLNPGKHGIYDFITPTGELISSRRIKGKKLWQISSENGLSCCIVNVPITYPPEEINGCMISSFLTPPGRKDFVYPPSFMQILEKNGYRIDIEFETGYRGFFAGEKDMLNRWGLLPEIYDISERRYKTALDLLKKKPWDFFFIVFKQTDVVQHFFWDKKDILLDFYQKIDGYISDIISCFKKECCNRKDEMMVFLVSDHGFGPHKSKFNLSALIKKQKCVSTTALAYASLCYATRRLYSFLGRITPTNLFKKQEVSQMLKNRASAQFPFRGETYGVGGGIYIDRQHPAVKDYERLREKIINGLKMMKNPRTGKRVFNGAWKREEIYKGPYVNRAPDVIYLMEPGHSAEFDFSRINDDWLEPTFPGDHCLNGILLLMGSYIKENMKLDRANIYDVSPTILYLMGLPIPEDVDGEVLTQTIQPDFLQKNPVKYQKVTAEVKEESKVYTDKEEEKIKKRLKGLGYLD
jgi:predicted AlkP superfamily phosphohydrolase/phosphomutase